MQITPCSMARFLNFLERIATETYPEVPTEGHTEITLKAQNYLFNNFELPPSARILDVGCGQGVALLPFQKRGYSPTGITLNATDAAVCQDLGFDVRVMDQSFLDFEDNSFDLVWARHVIEHSFMPLYTLTEFRRVLRSGGILYMEVPAPDTLLHEQNPNHYSVLGKEMWCSLLERTGFAIAGTVDFFLDTLSGRTDSYWGYFAVANKTAVSRADSRLIKLAGNHESS